MRPRIVILVLAIAALASIVVVLSPGSAGVSPASSANSRVTLADSPDSTTPSPPPQTKPSPSTRETKLAQQDDQHRALVHARADQLMELAMGDDTNSLQVIVEDLNNSDPDIRKAAIDATIQYGSRDAIPFLENAAYWAETPQEKTEIAQAIEFLSLPRLDEAIAANLSAETPQPSSSASRIPAKRKTVYHIH